MSSWLSDLAKRGEAFLENVDQTAAAAALSPLLSAPTSSLNESLSAVVPRVNVAAAPSVPAHGGSSASSSSSTHFNNNLNEQTHARPLTPLAATHSPQAPSVAAAAVLPPTPASTSTHTFPSSSTAAAVSSVADVEHNEKEL